jgi:hypothetical protein
MQQTPRYKRGVVGVVGSLRLLKLDYKSNVRGARILGVIVHQLGIYEGNSPPYSRRDYTLDDIFIHVRFIGID